jgi:cold shock CspA family protein
MVEDRHEADGTEEAGSGPETASGRPDFYYHGIVRRLSPRKGTGVVRTASGREVRFSYQMVRMSGQLTSPKSLKEGMVVGYDLGWTSHGLRVTRIKTY